MRETMNTDSKKQSVSHAEERLKELNIKLPAPLEPIMTNGSVRSHPQFTVVPRSGWQQLADPGNPEATSRSVTSCPMKSITFR